MGKSRSPALALALLLALTTRAARAETAWVSVDVPCPPTGTFVEGVAEILQAQLAPLQVVLRPRSPAPAPALEVTVDACNGAGEQLEIVVSYRGQRSSQRIDLGDVPVNARSRTLALALAESVHHTLDEHDGGHDAPTSHATLPPEPPAVPGAAAVVTPEQGGPQESGPPAQAPERTTALEPLRQPGPKPRAASELALRVAPFMRYAFKTATPYAGLQASAGVRRFDLRLRGLASRRAVEDSSVWQGAVLAVLGANWLTLRSVTLRSELEAGAAWAAPKSGEASLARTAIAPHVGGSLGVRLVSPLARHWFLETELGVGAAASLTAQAYQVDLMSLSGLFVQTSLGVGWSALSL